MATLNTNPVPLDENKEGPLPHMPQLDVLRAFAVFAVLVHHFIDTKALDFANEGVKLFFVLSGFLITGILAADPLSLALAFSRIEFVPHLV